MLKKLQSDQQNLYELELESVLAMLIEVKGKKGPTVVL